MRFAAAVAALLSTATVQAANIVVKVGANSGLVFDPSSVTAAAGDTISFQFQGKNHSVTQSTFASPCVLQTTPSKGVDSGFIPVAANATSLPQWSITVDNATAPLWFFCAQTNPVSHCQKGMVFAVNPTATKTFAQFQANAMGGNSSASASGSPSSGASGTPAASGTAPATTSAKGSGALRIGGSAAGFLTAAALLVGIDL
ncbi:hypothetical protein M413DRAFT_86148 [Hebeloma cylindrosporum]|uniref:Phytocyanin domain-containing protein n=1 Tax=Hebeloma cylindrosporum TaxID=76867 RepID=A0A0C3CJB4_HEBCY|nr:hypothetical protein M413DRAFT_86148 [Hebeloma cylindrosporum h7]